MYTSAAEAKVALSIGTFQNVKANKTQVFKVVLPAKASNKALQYVGTFTLTQSPNLELKLELLSSKAQGEAVFRSLDNIR